MRLRLNHDGSVEPLECPAGHIWPRKGGRLAGWSPCECAGVFNGGHRTYRCMIEVDGHECGAVARIPPHEPGTRRSVDPRLQLITHPAAVPAGVSRIDIHYNHRVIGDLDFRVCPYPCEVGVIEQIRVDAEPVNYRRRGFAREALRAALVCGLGYTWSTTVTAAQAAEFWAAVGTGIAVGRPVYCAHMREADARTP